MPYKARNVLAASAVYLLSEWIQVGEAYSAYANQVPNVGKVEHFGVTWTTLGHPGNGGSTSAAAANPFGRAVNNNQGGNVWAKICNEDSDGDGFTNGEELCDPFCVWVAGQPDPTDCRTDEVEGNTLGAPTHPGFADGDNGVFSLDPNLAHGAMMILAWLILAPIGVGVAMTQKKKGVDGRIDWFKLHRSMLIGAVLFTLIAWIIMLATTGFVASSLHTQIGLAVVILSLIQPVSGALRPHIEQGVPKDSKRLWWEAQHQWLGRIIMFLAAFALVTGIRVGFGSLIGGYVVAGMFAIAAAGGFVYVLGFRDVESEEKIVNDYLKSTGRA